MTLLPGLSGQMCVRNCERLDYCWQEAISSMLPVCDEVVICDSDSDDGTRQIADAWAARDPRIRVINWPYPNPAPFGDREWTNRWTDFMRGQLRYDMQLWFSADEIIDPAGYPEIREAVGAKQAKLFRYVNFKFSPWLYHIRSEAHVFPLAPTSMYFHTHGPGPAGVPCIRSVATLGRDLTMYHYSTLRNRAAYDESHRIVLETLEGVTAPDTAVVPLPEDVAPFTGCHPPVIRDWLAAHGHPVDPATGGPLHA